MMTQQERETRNAEMYRRYTSGWSTREVADEFGLDAGRIRRIFHDRGWPMRAPGGRGHRAWQEMNRGV